MKVVTKESIRELPLIEFQGEIHVINDPDQATDVCRKLSSERILGFDTEKKPAFKKGEYYDPALVQLATEEDAYLFQLHKIGFVEPIKILLEDTTIAKLGVALQDDLKDLNKMNSFTPRGFIELAELAKERDVPYFGLRNLTAFFLDKRLSKSQQVSNWENDKLTPRQQVYAATDAWVALKIYEGLNGLV